MPYDSETIETPPSAEAPETPTGPPKPDSKIAAAQDALRRGRDAAWTRWSKLGSNSKIAVAGGAAAIAIAAGMLAFSHHDPQVATASVARGSIEQTVLATGVLEPSRLVSVGAQASGQVKKLHVVLGQQVRAGQLIAEIDSTTQNNSVETAEASLRQARAQRAQAAADLLLSQRTYARQQQLLNADAVSRADFEAAEADLAAKRAQVENYDAQIASAQISLETARANLGYTRIVAPMDGTVVAIVTNEGQTVNANQSTPTIVKLAALETMTVSAEISEADVTKVHAGQTVYFTTLGSDDRHYAQLRSIEPAPNEIKTTDDFTSTDTAVYFDGLFDVENPDGVLRTGMTAQVTIVLSSASNVLTMPASALGQRNGDGTYNVQVLTGGGRIEMRHVKVGANNNVSAQVLQGLSEGDRVVTAEASADSESSSSSSSQSRGRPPGGMMMGGPPR